MQEAQAAPLFITIQVKATLLDSYLLIPIPYCKGEGKYLPVKYISTAFI